MPFEWAHFLAVAEEFVGRTQEAQPDGADGPLSIRPPDAAYLRSAISRAYYTAYGTARDSLRAEGMMVPGLESHVAVWQAYRDHPRPNRIRAQIETVGSRLNRHRRQADYDPDVPGLAALAQRAIADAGLLLRWLGALEDR